MWSNESGTTSLFVLNVRSAARVSTTKRRSWLREKRPPATGAWGTVSHPSFTLPTRYRDSSTISHTQKHTRTRTSKYIYVYEYTIHNAHHAYFAKWCCTIVTTSLLKSRMKKEKKNKKKKRDEVERRKQYIKHNRSKKKRREKKQIEDEYEMQCVETRALSLPECDFLAWWRL